MELETSDVGERATRIILRGRLDVPGVDQIETRFTALSAAAGRDTLVDLSGVSFIASMGIRMFIAAARGMQLKRRKMVLYAAPELVKEVLENVNLSAIIPVVADESAALKALSS